MKSPKTTICPGTLVKIRHQILVEYNKKILPSFRSYLTCNPTLMENYDEEIFLFINFSPSRFMCSPVEGFKYCFYNYQLLHGEKIYKIYFEMNPTYFDPDDFLQPIDQSPIRAK